MGDVVKYRIPQQEIIELCGEFKQVQRFEDCEGFIVSSFNKEDKFCFYEGNQTQTNSYSSKIPICYREAEYNELASLFLSELKEQHLSKAIFSRIKPVEFNVDCTAFFNDLCSTYPNAFVYLISSPFFGTWIGASPEILIVSHEKNAKTMSLAGTLKSDSTENWKSKEIEEQKHVTDFIETQLKNVKVQNLIISNQQEVNAGPVRHLKTSFEFDLGTNSAIEIAEKLHPTPAVSGFPQKEAIQLIQKIEKHNRKLYAGMIGVIEKNKTHLYVNLRCSEIIQNNAYLYLGGGFTKNSSVVSEWNETENKAKTLLNVMKKQ